MLTVSPLINTATNDDSRSSAEEAPDFVDFAAESLPDLFTAGEDESSLGLVDCFDDLFIEIGDGFVLPDLEMDAELLGEYSGGEEEANTASDRTEKEVDGGSDRTVETVRKGKYSKHKGKKKKKNRARNREKEVKKKKPKVDWTPELHRKFLRAVEELGMEKAVPSRILELMNVEFLTRHNIASHLQKYRSHRKHVLAREAEAASWSLRRHGMVAGGGKKPWTAPAFGYPHVPQYMHQVSRPLHVWGHPMAVVALTNAPWSPVAQPPPTPSYTNWPHQPIYQQSSMSKSETSNCVGVATGHLGPSHPPFDSQPTNESIDAAIGDVMSKPWLPLPLGLKPPSLDGVMTELQLQGISNVPPLS